MKKRLSVLAIIISVLVCLCACSNQKKETLEMTNEITKKQSEELLQGSDSLPVGTVVLLENSTRKVMIIGVLQFDSSDQSVIYDYSGVLYPEGLIDPENNYLFNHDQIERIYHLGYHNEEQDALQEKIDEYYESGE